jgi:hypothetical protein
MSDEARFDRGEYIGADLPDGTDAPEGFRVDHDPDPPDEAVVYFRDFRNKLKEAAEAQFRDAVREHLRRTAAAQAGLAAGFGESGEAASVAARHPNWNATPSGPGQAALSSKPSKDDVPSECEWRGCERPPDHYLDFEDGDRAFYCSHHPDANLPNVDTRRVLRTG